jgi:hypothetical protein
LQVYGVSLCCSEKEILSLTVKNTSDVLTHSHKTLQVSAESFYLRFLLLLSDFLFILLSGFAKAFALFPRPFFLSSAPKAFAPLCPTVSLSKNKKYFVKSS